MRESTYHHPCRTAHPHAHPPTSCRHQGSASLPHSSFHYPSRKWGTSHKINCWATPNILHEEKQVAPAIPCEGEPRGSAQHTGQPCMGPRHWISAAWKQDKAYLVRKHEGEPVHAPKAQGAKHHQAKGQGTKHHCITSSLPEIPCHCVRTQENGDGSTLCKQQKWKRQQVTNTSDGRRNLTNPQMVAFSFKPKVF
jgi:hypothetical protein